MEDTEDMEDIVYLPRDPELVRTIARWHQDTWGHLTGRGLETRIEEFQEQLESRKIPLTVVAFADGTPAGTASLLTRDMDTHPDLSPWLGSVFVLPQFRQRGIGERLCRRVMAESERLGLDTLYLFTEDRAPFYHRMGWEAFSEEPYMGEEVTLMKLKLPGPSQEQASA
jgi:N-acetylglutamate synthase-like GNAT family acetyltransferase